MDISERILVYGLLGWIYSTAEWTDLLAAIAIFAIAGGVAFLRDPETRAAIRKWGSEPFP